MTEPEFALSQRPDVAFAIGGLFMAVANFEATILGCFATLLGYPNRIAAAIFENIENISARSAIVFEMAEALPDKPMSKTLIQYKADILAALAMRNKLAHSLYGVDEGKKEILLLQNFLSKRRGAPKSSAVDPNALVALSQKLSNASTALSVLITDTDLTPRHRMKD